MFSLYGRCTECGSRDAVSMDGLCESCKQQRLEKAVEAMKVGDDGEELHKWRY